MSEPRRGIRFQVMGRPPYCWNNYGVWAKRLVRLSWYDYHNSPAFPWNYHFWLVLCGQHLCLEDAGFLKVQHDALPSQQDKDTRSLPVTAQREVWGTRAHNLLRSIEMRS